MLFLVLFMLPKKDTGTVTILWLYNLTGNIWFLIASYSVKNSPANGIGYSLMWFIGVVYFESECETVTVQQFVFIWCDRKKQFVCERAVCFFVVFHLFYCQVIEHSTNTSYNWLYRNHFNWLPSINWKKKNTKITCSLSFLFSIKHAVKQGNHGTGT